MNMNSTTAITLNDRFSLIKKPSQTNMAGRGRSRSRSREPRQRQRQQRGVDLRGSQRNRALLDKLERQHKMRMALKLKNKSILTTRGRIQGQIARTKLKRAAAIKKTMNARTLSRNNLTKFIPLNDTPGRMNRGRSRSRSRSRSRNRVQNVPIQERLGFPAGRRRMRRGGQQQQNNGRSRSRSRVRLNRNNFRNGNQAPLKRSNSVNARLGGNGPANIVQRQQQQARRRRTRSQSRGGNNNNNNRRQGNQTRLNRPLQGRITKRIQRKPGLATVRRNIAGNAIKNMKKLKRGQAGITKKLRGGQQQQGNARGRARNRGQRNNNQQGQQQQQQQQQRRGRSRTRRGGNNSRGGKQQISKEMLDKQLDDYMSKGSA